MPHALHHLYVHLVWSTWDRAPVLDDQVRAWLWPALAERARSAGAHLTVVGGTVDHVHVLTELPATVAVADLVKDLKGATSREWARRQDVQHQSAFRWQGGYGAFTVGRDGLQVVEDYVRNQAAHHALGTAVDLWEKSRDQPA